MTKHKRKILFIAIIIEIRNEGCVIKLIQEKCLTKTKQVQIVRIIIPIQTNSTFNIIKVQNSRNGWSTKEKLLLLKWGSYIQKEKKNFIVFLEISIQTKNNINIKFNINHQGIVCSVKSRKILLKLRKKMEKMKKLDTSHFCKGHRILEFKELGIRQKNIPNQMSNNHKNHQEIHIKTKKKKIILIAIQNRSKKIKQICRK